MSAPDTRTRLLDAAERRFAEQGFEGASLRDITADAEANLAAAHYHFGSKEDLFVAVLARRIEPMNVERMRMLDAAEARAHGGALKLETIVEALVGPPLRHAAAGGPSGGCMLRLFGRVQSEPGELWKRVIDGPLRPIRERLFAALRRALPELPEAELAWRMHFAIGAMAGVINQHHRLHAISGGLCDPRDTEGTIARLVPFLSAAMRAPLPRKRSAPKRHGARA